MSTPSSTIDTDIERLLQRLTREEKVSLLAATDWWRTPVIKRENVFVPHIKSTDGPNGARGESYVSGIKAACFPCGTSLGASFDRELLYRNGQEIAKEAQTKAANILLAPTLNVIRSPRGGRNYETFSEDPVVLGTLSAAFVNGCQSVGIAATPKHFVANDTENNRKILSAEVDEQTLQELYMLPFQIVLRLSDPWCLMTSYNRVNGTYVADDARLVNGTLREEWGFQGVVVSDWMGVYSTAECINAGVDLDMPGPTRYRGEKLIQAMEKGEVSPETVDDSARRILQLAKKLGRFENPHEPPEQAVENVERDAFIRDAAAEGMVLLKNQDILPLPKTATVALIGHHALTASLGGGGSARVDSLHAVNPVEGLRDAGFNVAVSAGVPVFGALPHADAALIYSSDTKTQAREPVTVEWFNGSTIGQNLVHQETRALPEYMIKEKWPSHLSPEYCTRMTFDLCPTAGGDHILSIISTGPAIVYINGEKVYDRPQETDLSPESFYFFKSKLERRLTYHMDAGKFYTLVLESWNTDPEILSAKPLYGRMFQGSAFRFHEEIDIPRRITDACEAAGSAEYAVVCVGTTSEIESEGFDRETFDLSPEQYNQILAVASHNPKTIVVNFSGGPVNMSQFIDQVPAIIQAWFPGQECGQSLALVLNGSVNPSGRLPFSWPKADEDNASYANFPCDENNIIRYEEALGVGYRYYDLPDSPEPLFPFGFGLSYTQFNITNIRADNATITSAHDTVHILCDVENLGSRDGAVVVQCYVVLSTVNVGHKRPLKELKEFHKIKLRSHERQELRVALDKYSVSFYNAAAKCWQTTAGWYRVMVGLSCQEICGTTEIIVSGDFQWTGI